MARARSAVGASRAVSVRDLMADFPDTAYTTLMTTLDRLHRKELLLRKKLGRAFVYQPRLSRVEFESARAADAFRQAVAQSRDRWRRSCRA